MCSYSYILEMSEFQDGGSAQKPWQEGSNVPMSGVVSHCKNYFAFDITILEWVYTTNHAADWPALEVN